ncbi:uncharacterized protein LOC131324541 isoform X2 [Rhododendron vialii]|uniref:uncharacterized protein LOC131324541 isoform X2 n=1 Tax=Rhododendron vialii TaxID=182163 RepID=UPI00265E4B0F|nr:uncharacterized protein LOC131324541 isoform X2 [Rhododendron vialii]XP_058212511.1 uncharacterized protein LOC131324541 isoform X2 [Rhododendron vialii]
MKRSHSLMLSGIEPTKLPEDDDKCLYVVFMYTTGLYSHSLHRISVADLKLSSRRHRHGEGKPKKLPEPILKLSYRRFPGFMGFFSVGSKIYMVGGGVCSAGVKPIASRRCYVFDTCDNPLNLLEDGPAMHHEKLQPIVLGPLNGKFYVLGRTLASGDLEEFDPKAKCWTRLPLIPTDLQDHSVGPRFGYKRDEYEVRSNAIVGNKILFTTHKGTYAFDVVSRKWERPSSLGTVVKLPFCEQSVFLDGLWYAFLSTCRSSVWAYNFDWVKGFQESQELGVRRPYRRLKHSASEIMVPMGERTLVVVRAGFSHSSRRKCYVTFDMCQFACKSRGKPKHPKVSGQYSTSYRMESGLYELLGLSACLVTSSD